VRVETPAEDGRWFVKAVTFSAIATDTYKGESSTRPPSASFKVTGPPAVGHACPLKSRWNVGTGGRKSRHISCMMPPCSKKGGGATGAEVPQKISGLDREQYYVETSRHVQARKRAQGDAAGQMAKAAGYS